MIINFISFFQNIGSESVKIKAHITPTFVVWFFYSTHPFCNEVTIKDSLQNIISSKHSFVNILSYVLKQQNLTSYIFHDFNKKMVTFTATGTASHRTLGSHPEWVRVALARHGPETAELNCTVMNNLRGTVYVPRVDLYREHQLPLPVTAVPRPAPPPYLLLRALSPVS